MVIAKACETGITEEIGWSDLQVGLRHETEIIRHVAAHGLRHSEETIQRARELKGKKASRSASLWQDGL
jgi:hypothetical protein